jgi:hypothetical protein
VVAELLDNGDDIRAELGLSGLSESGAHGGKTLALWGGGERTGIGASSTVARDVLGDATASRIDPELSIINDLSFCHCQLLRVIHKKKKKG